MEAYSADNDEVLGGASTLTSSWMEQTPSIQRKNALNHPLEHVRGRMTTRRWRTNYRWSIHLDFIVDGDNMRS